MFSNAHRASGLQLGRRRNTVFVEELLHNHSTIKTIRSRSTNNETWLDGSTTRVYHQSTDEQRSFESQSEWFTRKAEVSMNEDPMAYNKHAWRNRGSSRMRARAWRKAISPLVNFPTLPTTNSYSQ